MRSFLGLCGTVRIWIANYSLLSRPLVNLYHKDTPFIWDTPQQDAFNALKIAVSSAPFLHPINYLSDFPVVLSVDTSYIAIGFILSQYDESGHKRPAHYGSLPINEHESRYSQPKLKLYGLFCALRHYHLFLYSVKNLHVKVDAKYIKGMLNDPDLQPNTTINRWIEGILLFNFKLIHISAAHHRGPDALSRHQPTDEDIEEGERDAEEADEWLEDLLLLSAAHPPPYDPITLPSFLSQDMTQDVLLRQILHFLQTTELLSFPSNSACKCFIRRSLQFFICLGYLFKCRGPCPPTKVIFDPDLCMQILSQAYEDLGHHGVFRVFQAVRDCFYWPQMYQDVAHHVRSCHECQICSTRKAEVPLTISPSP